MSGKRIYVKGRVGDRQYVGHMTNMDVRWTFDIYEEISKVEYRSARATGVQSWGEYETKCKRDGIDPCRRTSWAW